MIEVISATRQDPSGFRTTPLGISLDRLSFDSRLSPQITFANVRELPEVYNARIEAKSDSDILLFIHDDVWIDDYFIADRVIDGLVDNQVIGVAGSRRIAEIDIGWCFKNEKGEWDKPYLSGAVAHGGTPFGRITYFGPSLALCELLDGVLLAARRSVLIKAGVKFDTRFNFHFYDLDFCRSARRAGLRLRTWRIAITHNSGGAFGTPAWREALKVYQRKWR